MIFRKRNPKPTASLESLQKAVLKLHIRHPDNEAAHMSEDALHVAALGIIASGVSNPEEVAKTALQTVSIDFDRRYA